MRQDPPAWINLQIEASRPGEMRHYVSAVNDRWVSVTRPLRGTDSGSCAYHLVDDEINGYAVWWARYDGLWAGGIFIIRTDFEAWIPLELAALAGYLDEDI
jgi:hypothetical protein